MNLGGLGTFNVPLPAPQGGLRVGGGADVNSAQPAAFQIPAAPLSAAPTPSVPSAQIGLPELSGQLDNLVEKFLEEMQKKTGLGPNLLMTSLNESMQKLPDAEAMLKVFSSEVLQSAHENGIDVSSADLKKDFRAFLKDLQNTITNMASDGGPAENAAEVDKKFQFEVLTETQARDKRTQALVEKVQKDFFGVQAARPAIENPDPLAARSGADPRLSTFSAQEQAPRLQTTDQFFQSRQQEEQLLHRLRDRSFAAKSAESVPAQLSVMSEDGPEVFGQESSTDTFSLEESLLNQIAIAGPAAPVAQGGAARGEAANAALEGALQAHIPEDAKVENLNEIIQRARVAATGGGGEMELELKPEGLGKVQIKVSVEGDQVQVQMTAESKRVQELLKDGLQDLRSQLAMHKLNSEALRVEGSPQGQEADLSRRDAAQDQQQRSFAQGFMQQFREDRQAARGALTRFPDPEGPSGGRSTDVVRPLSHTPRAHEGRLSLIA